jgi:hypothetical protein
MALLQALQGLFIPLDGGFQLADILCPTLAEGRLGLAVTLLAFLGGGVDLIKAKLDNGRQRSNAGGLRTGLRPPFLFCVCAGSCVMGSASASGVDMELSEPS